MGGVVAQLVEQDLCKVKVAGSTPVGSTSFACCDRRWKLRDSDVARVVKVAGQPVG